jgi:hypothetical protein
MELGSSRVRLQTVQSNLGLVSSQVKARAEGRNICLGKKSTAARGIRIHFVGLLYASRGNKFAKLPAASATVQN